VAVAVEVGVLVGGLGVLVAVGVGVLVGLGVEVAVLVGIGVLVGVGTLVGTGVGVLSQPSTGVLVLALPPGTMLKKAQVRNSTNPACMKR
jgi:hypothetical protein